MLWLKSSPLNRKIQWCFFNIFIIFYAPFVFSQNTSTWQLLLLDVEINQRQMPQVMNIYRDSQGKLWLAKADLSMMGLNVPSGSGKIIDGNDYLPLSALKDIQSDLDLSHLHLMLNAPPEDFHQQTINNTQDQIDNNHQIIRPNAPGLFLNYDISTEHTPDDDTTSNTAALTELGLFNHYGTGSTYYLLQNNPTDSDQAVRLDTTWTQDQPENLATWRWGDSITSTAPWSGAARFGGIQYATNFNTQPNLVTFPLPNIQGEAVLPSNVDLFVNNTLNQQTQVNPGPFIINNVPVITGAGNMSVVTQDIMGRTQTVTLPYYAAPQLLKSGLTDFSYESGFIRENYGIDSNDYGPFVTSATYGKGITDTLTLTQHGELLADQQTYGTSASYLWQQFGVFSFSLAASRDAGQGEGGLIGIGFDRQATPLNYGAQTTYTSSQFTQVGLASGQSSPISTTQIFSGYDMGYRGSFAVTYTYTQSRNDEDASEDSFAAPSAEIVTLSYTKTIEKSLSITTGVIDSLKDHEDDQIFLMLTWAPDADHSASVNTTHQDGGQQYSAEFNKALPVGNGYGYQLYESQGVNNQTLASGTVNTEVGQYNIAASQFDGENNYRFDAQGSIIHFAGVTQLSRDFDSGGSFGLVQVPDIEDVHVYDQNQLIGTTDEEGNLFIPNLLPYQNNQITIEPKDLPINSEVNETEQQVIPYYKSGSLVKFLVNKTYAVIFHLKQTSGDDVPAGALLHIDNSHHDYLVGEQGEVYVETMLQPTLQGTAYWDEQECHFKIVASPTHEDIPDLGEIKCE